MRPEDTAMAGGDADQHDYVEPAFPCMPPIGMDSVSAEGYPYPSAGISMRDYFAAKALEGRLAAHEVNLIASDLPFLAASCYDIADAMLKARQS